MAELGETTVNSARDLETTRGQMVTLLNWLGVAVIEMNQLLAVARDRDAELTGKPISQCDLLASPLCFSIDGLVLVCPVTAAYADLNESWSRWMHNAAWMNDAITKPEEGVSDVAS